MNKLIKTILIISALMPFALVQAQADNLVVQFQQTPLFNEANFLPGEGITRWVKVTNESGAIQRIATQPLNITDLNRLGDVLNLEIKEGGVTRYNNALSNFFAGGENYLSSLANGATTQYDFTVSFYSGSQNTFQGKTLGFDILIGFQGTEGGILPGAGSTSGGGGGGMPGMLPPGLTIQNESTASTTENSVTITWTTSYPATSQVIYALGSESHILDLTDRTGAPPKYGYTRTTPEYDSPANINGVLSHSITISDLTPDTTYYYRTVSHGSLAISTEHSFTTLTPEAAIATAMAEAVEAPPTGVSGIGEEGGETFLGGDQAQEGAGQENFSEEFKEEEGLLLKSKDFSNFAAALTGFLKTNPFYLLTLFIILLIVIVLLVALNKKRSKI